MKLTIKSVTAEDYGTYKCLSRNALGDTDGTIKIYRKFSILFKCLTILLLIQLILIHCNVVDTIIFNHYIYCLYIIIFHLSINNRLVK